MKRILVLSDSHSGNSFMRWCVDTVKPDAIVHLGDFYDDGDELHEENRQIPIYQVAGNCDRYAAPPGAREILIEPVCGVELYTDYGHNPAEMASALENASKQPHNRLFAVMQPHTYSRVKTLFDGYIHCCDLADEILITDIFAAREKDPGDIHSTMLVDAIKKTGKSVHYTPTFDDCEAFLRKNWQPGDLVITMSCGNIHLLNAQIQEHGDDYKM